MTKARARTLAVLVFVALAGIGCSSGADSHSDTGTKSSPNPTAPPGGFHLTVDGTPSSDTIAVSGKTDLPEGTAISISAARAFRAEGANSPQDAELGHASTNVHNGGFSLTLPISDEILLTGIDLPGYAIETVSPAIALCATVRTGKDLDGQFEQADDDVRARIGDNGEALKHSPGASEFGSATDSPSTEIEMMKLVTYAPPVGAIRAQQGSQPAVGTLEDFCV
jgi:hypothetical protein